MCVGFQNLPAYKHIFASIESADTVLFGMWDKHLDQIAIDKESVIRRGGTSI